MKYNKKEFEELINDILHKAGYNVIVHLLLLTDQTATKWWDKEYTCNFDYIEENTKYGVKYESSYYIEFDFKTGKIDNLLKTFITQFSSKYKYIHEVDGEIVYKTDKVEIQKTIIEKNQDRVSKGLLYTTLYGIGFWAIFCSKKDIEVAKELHDYLNEKDVKFHNEWSDAGWVYRFVINNKVEVHNELLDKFKAK